MCVCVCRGGGERERFLRFKLRFKQTDFKKYVFMVSVINTSVVALPCNINTAHLTLKFYDLDLVI